MNTDRADQTPITEGLVFIEIQIVMDPGMHGDSRIVFRAEGHSAESVAIALTSLTGDLDETATALSSAVLTQNEMIGELSVDDAIALHVHADFRPPLVASYQVEVSSPLGFEAVTVTVTTPSIASMIGALFIHFSGAVSRILDTLANGLENPEHSGVLVFTNLSHHRAKSILTGQ